MAAADVGSQAGPGGARGPGERGDGPAARRPELDPRAAAEAVAPLVRVGAADAERDRRLPDALVAELRDAGLFRLSGPP